MARMNKTERLKEVHKRAMKDFNRSYAASWTIRLDAMESRRFVDVTGAMWEGVWGEQFANRPRFEINKIARACDRVFNEYRANRVTVDYQPASADDDDEEMAELLDGLFRADEQYSNAQEAYDTAFQEGIKGGYGAYRLRNDYDDAGDEENEDQRILFEPINDADISVYFDINAKRYDKADAAWCIVLSPMARDTYEEEYDDYSVASWTQPFNGYYFEWVTPDVVWLAEYYVREEHYSKVFTYVLPQTEDEQKLYSNDFDTKSELEAEQERLEAMGYVFQRERKLEYYKVRKYILNGCEVIDDCGYIAGEHIPVIPFYGKRTVIQGVERCHGIVQPAKDSQRLYNVQVSTVAEIAALGMDSVPVLFPEEIAGHENRWNLHNVHKYAFLTRNPVTGADGEPRYDLPLSYTQPRQIPPAVAALSELTNRDIQDVTGNSEQATELNSNVSGVAVQAVQNRLDMGAFGYLDNFAQTQRRCGEVWLSMRKDIERRARKVTTVAEDGSQSFEDIMMPVIDPDTGAEVLKNDISRGKYKVVVSVAPSFTTRRDATVQRVIELMGTVQDPQAQAVLQNFAIMNMNGEGMTPLRKFARSQLVAMGVEKPTQEEQEKMAQEAANQQPSAQDQYLMAAAQEKQVNAQKAIVDTERLAAQADKTVAETLQILQQMDINQLQTLSQIAQQLSGQQQAAQPQSEL